MIYIYNDYGGTHTTSLAAAYHLNLINPSDKPLTSEEVLAVPYFNQLTKKDFGKLIFHGEDEEGHPVYTIGRKTSKLVVPALSDLCHMFMNLFDIDDRIIFSNTSPTVPFVMTMGGMLSRGLGIDSLGVPLLIKGAQKCHPSIHELVKETKRVAHSHSNEKVIVLKNKEFQA
ncbi:DUF3189 family protein [Halobacillus sp. BBL2006]|uniref:DUF3189 family protein n=1 Tax=Halobacillus sp. BBL2006 TaxID=1543706 RepID=UPI000543B2EF|nr:DUF3189 family protein [Halobacillus sp. BBL2006]KHE67699.1 ABC transporter [Halobacillus sp. BBL2006]